MMPHRSPFLLLFAALLSACARTNTDSSPQPTITDSAGIAIVDNEIPQWDELSHWQVDTVPTTRIGADDSQVESQFTIIGEATRLSNGNVVVALQNEVRMFGPDGKFIRTVARDGSGPGEFRSISTMRKLADDTILVSQAMVEGGRKIALFSKEGTYLREERPDNATYHKLGPWSECLSRVFPDRSWLACKPDSTIPETASNRPSKRYANGMSSPGPGHFRRLQRWHIVPPTLDTTYPIGIEGGIEQFGVALKNGGETFIVHPFYSRSLIASGGTPLRIATITNPAYSIELWTPQGKLERIVRKTNGRRAPTPQEVADAREALLARNARRLDPENHASSVDAVPTPDSLPAAFGLHVSSDGHIAVARHGQFPSHVDTVYDIFNSAGHWLGELVFPKRTFIRELGTDYILAMRITDDDVPVLETYRLRRGSSSGNGTSQPGKP